MRDIFLCFSPLEKKEKCLRRRVLKTVLANTMFYEKGKEKENPLRLIGVACYAKNANGFFKDSCKCFFVDKAVSLRGDNVFKLFASAPVGNRLSSVIEGFCRKGIRVSADDKGEVEEIAHPFLLQ